MIDYYYGDDSVVWYDECGIQHAEYYKKEDKKVHKNKKWFRIIKKRKKQKKKLKLTM